MKISQAVAVGFLLMGFIGYIVKLIHIPINNIIMYVQGRTGGLDGGMSRLHLHLWCMDDRVSLCVDVVSIALSSSTTLHTRPPC